MKRLICIIFLAAVAVSACNTPVTESDFSEQKAVEVTEVLPITGTFINLPYQDVRNKYTNPQFIDNTDPQMWETKVAEMKKMGVEYLIFMSVANERKAYIRPS
jgi:hypothetical protein